MTEAQRESLCALIRQAGAHAQALRDAGLQVDKKSRQDFVSQADLAVEQEIKGWLKAHFPQEGFLGEESGFEGDEHTVWVLDPVDGTTNFILGMDYWCISLARVCQGELSFGIIYAPDRNEFFFAGRGEGAFLNGRRLTLREPDPDAVVISGGSDRALGSVMISTSAGPSTSKAFWKASRRFLGSSTRSEWKPMDSATPA